MESSVEDKTESNKPETPVEVPAMAVPFSASHNKTEGSITFVHANGKSFTILQSNRGFEKAKELLTAIDATEPGSDEENKLREELHELTVPASRLAKYELGDVTIKNGTVFYKDRVVHNVVADRLLWLIDHDEDPRIMLRFLNNLMQNPSYRSVQETFRFLEANKMAITRDGMILAYKKVDSEFKSIRSGKDGVHLDNTPGTKVSMPRNEVDDNSAKTCSYGLHLASADYLPHYGWNHNGEDRVVICVCNPRDVVSIPNDYNNAKMRVCEYTVLRELAKDEGDPLANKPVWEPEVAA